MVGELKQYQNLDMQEIFNTQKLFPQCCTWNHVSSIYTETENKCCKIMVIVQVFCVKPTPVSSLNPSMVSVFMVLIFSQIRQDTEKRMWVLFHAIFIHLKFSSKTRRCVRKARSLCHVYHLVRISLSKRQAQYEASPFQTVGLSISAIWFVQSKSVWGQQGYNS